MVDGFNQYRISFIYSDSLQCNKAYIGETSRCLYERCDQHKNDVANIAKNPNKTALVRHTSITNHQFDFEATKILRKVRTRGLLKIHEANNIILNEKQVVNFKKDAKHVSPVFYNLIKKSGKLKKVSRTINPPNLPPYQPNETTNNSIEKTDAILSR